MARPYEFYETPPGCTGALLANDYMHAALNVTEKPLTVLDPCAGEGAILDVIQRMLPEATIWGNDIDPDRGWPPGADATIWAGWEKMRDDLGRPAWVITNPPWSLAHEIIPHALNTAKVGVAMHLPLRFMEPTGDREMVLRAYPWTFQIVLGQPRPSYTEDGGTDSATSFWAVWVKDWIKMSLFYVTDPETRWRSIAPWENES